MTTDDLPKRIRESNDDIRFFFDESCLGIGKIVAAARTDAIYPGHPRSPIAPRTLDPEWIPVIAERGWTVVLRDKKIRHRPAEREALANNPLRVLVLTSGGNLGVWDQLRVLLRFWDDIDKVPLEDPPVIYAVTKRGLQQRDYPQSVTPNG